LSEEEKRVTEGIIALMEAEDNADLDHTYLEGLRLMLTQPEFVRQERMLHVLEMLEARDWLKSMFHGKVTRGGVSVVIGEESGNEALRDISLVFGKYGVPQRLGGSIGIIGPTRMDYARAISSVGYISDILSQLVGEVCSEE
jgi:heat-inducible transcriptional repressor